MKTTGILELMFMVFADVFFAMFLLSESDKLPAAGLLVEESESGPAIAGESGRTAPVRITGDSVVVDGVSVALVADGAAVAKELEKVQASGVTRVVVAPDSRVEYARIKLVLRLCVAAGLALELGD